MLDIQNLNVAYGDKKILQQLELKLQVGTHGIIGLNGAGKTTLFKTVFGLKKKETGSIFFHRENLKRSDVSFLETENFFYSYITGFEHLSLFQNPEFDLNTWNELLKLPLQEPVDGYSTGMKKKLAFLATIKQNKPIIILDEPFNGIDLESARSMSAVLQFLGKSKTILVSSHVLPTLTPICDSIHYLEKGKFQISTTPEEFDKLENEIFAKLDVKNQEIVNRLQQNIT